MVSNLKDDVVALLSQHPLEYGNVKATTENSNGSKEDPSIKAAVASIFKEVKSTERTYALEH